MPGCASFCSDYKEILQRNSTVMTHYAYKVGGVLPWDSSVYVYRQADTELYEGIISGQFCTVLGPRLTGKSSLGIQTRHRLRQIGYQCVTIQASELIDFPQGYYRWDKQLAALLWDSLYSENLAPLQQWLRETSNLLPQERLERIAGELFADLLEAGPVVIFVDAAEALLNIPFLANDLCDWIGHCLSLRKIYPLYKNLRFVISGSASLSKLIQNEVLLKNRRDVVLHNFTLANTLPLQRGFAERLAQPQQVIEAVLRWTNGQPILTQKLCYLLKAMMDDFCVPTGPVAPFSEAMDQWIDHVVQSRIIANWNRQDDLSHLWDVGYALINSRYRQQILSIYRSVLVDQLVEVKDTMAQHELLQSGLVIAENGQLKTANEIYRHVFSSLFSSSFSSLVFHPQ